MKGKLWPDIEKYTFTTGGIMSQSEPSSPFTELPAVQELRRHWVWFLLLGIFLVLAGFFSLSSLVIATLAVVLFFGFLLLGTGVLQALYSFWARRWSVFFLLLLGAILEIVVGGIMVTHPVEAAVELTLLLAVFMIIGGLFRIIASLALQFPNWGWTLLDGVVVLVLGVILWRHWWEYGLWFFGFYLGLYFIFRGVSWIMMALAVRQIPSTTP
jgi:uncharacterized membrane protein HdeD (DUF308 family)